MSEGLASENISENKLLKTAERVTQLGHHSGIAVLSGLTSFVRDNVVCHFKADPILARMQPRRDPEGLDVNS